ncbi:hypothetical protein JCM21900_000346 [Sporobolomyces salmonicolor]
MAPLIAVPASSTETQWLFSRAEVDHSPSIRAGMKRRDERRLRQKAVHVLWLLKDVTGTKQIVTTTAAAFLQRFYMRETFDNYDAPIAAAAAYFLACKVEEQNRSIKMITSGTFHIVRGTYRRFAPYPVDDQEMRQPEWIDLRRKILRYEEAMLHAMCFDMTVRDPHFLAGRALAKIWHYKGKGPAADDTSVEAKLERCVWGIVNDSLASPACLLYRPELIAAACLVLASAHVDQPLPPVPLSVEEQKQVWEYAQEEGEEPEPFEAEVYWLELLDVRAEEVKDAVHFLLENYTIAQDPFVVAESQLLAAKVLPLLETLPPWPPSSSSSSPAPARPPFLACPSSRRSASSNLDPAPGDSLPSDSSAAPLPPHLASPAAASPIARSPSAPVPAPPPGEMVTKPASSPPAL